MNLGDSVLHAELGIRFHLNKGLSAFFLSVKSIDLQAQARAP